MDSADLLLLLRSAIRTTAIAALAAIDGAALLFLALKDFERRGEETGLLDDSGASFHVLIPWSSLRRVDE